MSFLRCNRPFLGALRSSRPQRTLPITQFPTTSSFRRNFHAALPLWGVRSQILKDVGEGITEVQIIQWYVEEGAHIEEWKPLCQYQSDKAVDDITSRYAGVVKKLHFQADDTVPTGKALCEIEVEDGKYPEEHNAAEATPEPVQPSVIIADTPSEQSAESTPSSSSKLDPIGAVNEPPRSKYATLATPAVRGLLKTLNINILDISGTGKDGRVLKEDVHRFVAGRDAAAEARSAITPSQQTETTVNLTPIQSQMFKTMTRSLTVPHFLYADELNINNITAMRKKLASDPRDPKKVTFLSFVIKAVSLALNEYPLLNAKVDMSNPEKPKLIMRPKHNIGVAMDTPQGLIVPNIKDVGNRTILEIASEISRLSALGKDGKLTPADLSGGTITVSNIGNIGGTYVGPVIVPTEVAILGVGKSRTVPVFDDVGQVTKGELVNFSWSADHRVVDGATMARMATMIREFIESPELMLLNMR
ncbi:putative 2-oxo acid dehydrogenases acyltransferase [Aspergillus clavatus NRRL 1]|uniref:Dihydrolipoamide acetyltransferase component of pyruvate dehydrogenase complex n=1 Tax=Aspergillus clavatus (strain ATCC 1007 / CBS 513.65 / DSM 816 / NCTC 3887 / NRRL 1 / QM 1276 / 107) TaxID=344612 RepID=A1CIC7_ASPCL|nr:2-oxo acid dehydrogenases acyltransferase, putative [Aspergillus clavatus NRRL 1]EAW10632.1 2-oxo acid dehydrogenases acyltransferase, putative [Aspergillus clavatus NRRL 1]